LDKKVIERHWYADIYEQQENQTDDRNFMLKVIGDQPKNILEVCCGGGRLLVPLAKAGHTVTGLDSDAAMLAKIPPKAEGLANLSYRQADAVQDDWGEGFEIVVLAANIMINIESSMECKQAQQLFIQKAAKALKKGGYLYLDFFLEAHPEKRFNFQNEGFVVFEGVDSVGTHGRYTVMNGAFDPDTQLHTRTCRTEITPKDSETFVFEHASHTHIPTLMQVMGWLERAGFAVEHSYGDFSGNPMDETTSRAILWARKR